MMADDDEPERIFQQAIRFHQAQKILERSPDDQREALVHPVCVLAAFTIELLLKCLIRIEGGSPLSVAVASGGKHAGFLATCVTASASVGN